MYSHYDIQGLEGQFMQFFLWGILFGYTFIAAQFYMKHKARKGTASRALFSLAIIVILSGIAGYFPRLFVFPNAAMVGIHGLLFISIWSFALTRQTEVLADSLERRDDGDQY